MLKWVVLITFLLHFFPHRAIAAADVRLSFSPCPPSAVAEGNCWRASSLTLPPAQTVSLVADLGPHELAFAHVELTFDPALIRVDGEITTTPTLQTVVRKTNPDEANKTGRIVLALALSLGEQEPPTGTQMIAQIPLTSANNGNKNQTSAFQIDPERTKLITRDERLLSFDATSLSITARPPQRFPWLLRLLKLLRSLR